VRDIGPSRVVYFPWDIDRIFWEILHTPQPPAHGQRSRLGQRTGTSRAVVEGPGVPRHRGVAAEGVRYRFNIVNLTNPMMMRGSYREDHACRRAEGVREASGQSPTTRG